MRVLLSRLVALFGGTRLDAHLDEEVRAHLDLLTDDYIRRGMSPDEARLAARRASRRSAGRPQQRVKRPIGARGWRRGPAENR
jgi:hypothetical protein